MNENMQRESVIYALRDKAGQYGYVGSTTVNPKTRWWEHRSRARKGHSAPVYEWMRQAGIENVEIEVLEPFDDGCDPHFLEVKHIQSLLAAGHPIQNQIGRDGVPHSNAVRMKEINSRLRRGKPTWIKGKRGEEAGWTEARRKAASEMMKARHAK